MQTSQHGVPGKSDVVLYELFSEARLLFPQAIPQFYKTSACVLEYTRLNQKNTRNLKLLYMLEQCCLSLLNRVRKRKSL
jgi:hypothetical protein